MRAGEETTPPQPFSAVRPVGPVTHRTARNVAVRGIAEVLAKLATLSWTIVAARMLDQGDFGAFSYALSLVLLVSALPAWGFDPLLVRRASADPQQLPRLHTEALTWQTVLAVPTFVVTAFLALRDRPSPSAGLVLVLLLVAGLPELWSDTARSSATVRQDQLGVSRALVLQRIVTAVLIIGALVAGFGLVGVVAGFLGGTIVGWALHVAALRALQVHIQPRLLTWGGLWDMLTGTGYLGLSALVLILLFRLDTVLLGAIKGEEAVAVYTVAYRLLETVLFVTHAVKQAVLPVMSAKGGVSRVRQGFEQGLAAVAVVYVPFAVVALVEGDRVLALLFGDRYGREAGPVLAWLAPVPVLFASGYLGQSALLSQGRTRPLLVAALCATAVNVAINVLFIPIYAGVGAAVATAASYVVQVLVVHVFLRRGVGKVRLFRPLAEPTAAALLLAALLLALSLPLIVELVLGGGVYLTSWYLLARRTAPQQVAVVRGLLPGQRRR